MADPSIEYLAAGGNRHPSAADWAPELLVFGAGTNIALWDPNDSGHTGIKMLLRGHSDVVNSVRIFDTLSLGRLILSGSGDHTVRIWRADTKNKLRFRQWQCLTDHTASVNTMSVLNELSTFATGAADGTLKVWELVHEKAKLLQSISLKPRFLPLAAAFGLLDTGTALLAVAGTSASIQLYVRSQSKGEYHLQATLPGHDGWIRSLDFTVQHRTTQTDILLASASQDKYIRLWRFCRGGDQPVIPANDSDSLSNGDLLSNKVHKVGYGADQYSVAFEALLVGHEDWIYSARWAPPRPTVREPLLLSASADNSLAIWQREGSGLWVCGTRLGEISSQKGATTATGSAGGFWLALWSPDGQTVVNLGRTGSWRKWSYDGSSDSWLKGVGITGHTQAIQALAWSPDGSYLLSSSLDQTTRLFAERQSGNFKSWHEIARPQIHGYDLNCVASVTPNVFVSGADEKLLRVFTKPRALETLLSNLISDEKTANGNLPGTAQMPVLGLSNKAVNVTEDASLPTDLLADGNGIEPTDPRADTDALDLKQPPSEDQLARHTLWPEAEKLYGHGYEISAVATNRSGSLLATACKASSLAHAIIRLYETRDWRELKPSLTAHTLTVTSIAFSEDDRFLLSVGRDRQWALFEKETQSSNPFSPLCSDPKGHSRMILDCSWAPVSAGHIFATAGRDKVVKIWRLDNGAVHHISTLSAQASVTAVSFSPRAVGESRLVYGTEDGSITLVESRNQSWEDAKLLPFDKSICPTQTITSLEWRPIAKPTKDRHASNMSEGHEILAVASEDNSLRIFRV